MKINIDIKKFLLCKKHESVDQTRDAMRGTLITTGRMVATNGRTLITVEDEGLKPDKDYTVYIDKQYISKIKNSISGVLEIDTDTCQATTINKQGVFMCLFELRGVQYPNYKQIIPNEKAIKESEGVKQISLDPELLALFEGQVVLDFINTEQVISVNPVLHNYKGYIMPCRIPVVV